MGDNATDLSIRAGQGLGPVAAASFLWIASGGTHGLMNAVENVVGIQLAARGQSEYAFSVVLNSPIQIALVLAPLLVIISQIFGLAALTLVFSPLLVVALVLSVLLAAMIALDGESTWLEGATLVALYAIIATAFWWG